MLRLILQRSRGKKCCGVTPSRENVRRERSAAPVWKLVL